MAEYDPSNDNVDDVLKKLEKAKPDEQQRILAAERAGKARVTILEAYGVDPNERADASGRVLYPWEVNPDSQVVHEVDEDPEARKAREAQLEFDQQVARASGGVDEQGGATPAGTGTTGSPAAGTATAGGGAPGGF